ncbi:MAG: type II secretion system protein [Nitrospirales bacterium]|nr:MAG: type II secretion system protein [Nitrospirales bacterium]
MFTFRILTISLFAIVFFVACTPHQLDLAEEMVANENWDGAVTAYRDAVREDPFNEELQEKLDDVKGRAAEVHYTHGRKWLKDHRLADALQSFQMALGLVPGKPEYQTALTDVLRLKEARQALQEGKKLQNLGQLDEAMARYERAIQLDPSLTEALNNITAIAQQQNEQKAVGGSTEPVTLRFQNTRLKQVFEILARTAKIDILFDKDVRDDLVTIFTRDTPFDEALTLILNTNQLFAKRVSQDTLLIVPDTKQKREQYQDLKIRTFYLSNAKAKDIANLLRTILETKRVYVNEPLNTVVVRDEPAKLLLAEHIIHANDRGDAEVLFDVEVLEVNRTKTKRLGLNFAKQAGMGIFPPGATGFSNILQSFTFRDLVNLGPDSYLFTFPGSFLLDFFKQESDAKTLAAPKIRVLNNEKASINIGDKQPILLSTTQVLPGQASTGVTPTTSTVTSIEFKDTGIKLTVEPSIHLNNEISLRLQIEVTRLGDRVVLQSNPEISQFRFGTRTADTALSLKDGETVVLAGLLQEEDRKTRESVPGVDDVPLLGDLLSNSETNKVTTEVILVITAHVVNSVTPADLAKQTLWSGTAKNYDTKPLFSEPNVAAPVLFNETNPVESQADELDPTAPSDDSDARSSDHTPDSESTEHDETAEDEAAQTVTRLTLLPPALSTQVGKSIRLDLTGQDIPSIEKTSMMITYDPQILEFQQALEGTFWKDQNVQPSFTVSDAPNMGRVVIQMNGAGKTVKGNGQLATLEFHAKSEGNASLEIQRSSFVSPTGQPVPVITQHGRIWVQ